jgi:hypothetical protein
VEDGLLRGSAFELPHYPEGNVLLIHQGSRTSSSNHSTDEKLSAGILYAALAEVGDSLPHQCQDQLIVFGGVVMLLTEPFPGPIAFKLFQIAFQPRVIAALILSMGIVAILCVGHSSLSATSAVILTSYYRQQLILRSD